MCALRKSHSDVPENCDFVMYWWNLAAKSVQAGIARRFGFITTKGIGQPFAIKLVESYLSAPTVPMTLVFAIPNHPWVDSSDGADVRVAMTVCDTSGQPGRLSA